MTKSSPGGKHISLNNTFPVQHGHLFLPWEMRHSSPNPILDCLGQLPKGGEVATMFLRIIGTAAARLGFGVSGSGNELH